MPIQSEGTQIRFPARRIVPELMDDPAIDPVVHRRALAGLSRLNRWSRADAGIWSAIRKEASQLSRPLRVLDLATGSGDLPRMLDRRARQSGLQIEFAGCDISETAIALARQLSHGTSIQFFQCDVLAGDLPDDYDVVVASLFLHHLNDEQALSVMQAMAKATKRLAIVNDLDRSRMNVVLVSIACRILSRSPIVHFDGPASVRAAFTRHEAAELANAAGLANADVQSRFPCRWLLTWRKPQ